MFYLFYYYDVLFGYLFSRWLNYNEIQGYILNSSIQITVAFFWIVSSVYRCKIKYLTISVYDQLLRTISNEIQWENAALIKLRCNLPAFYCSFITFFTFIFWFFIIVKWNKFYFCINRCTIAVVKVIWIVMVDRKSVVK